MLSTRIAKAEPWCTKAGSDSAGPSKDKEGEQGVASSSPQPEGSTGGGTGESKWRTPSDRIGGGESIDEHAAGEADRLRWCRCRTVEPVLAPPPPPPPPPLGEKGDTVREELTGLSSDLPCVSPAALRRAVCWSLMASHLALYATNSGLSSL